MMLTPAPAATAVRKQRKKPFYTALWVQVLIEISFDVDLGFFCTANYVKILPRGDVFIRLITMV
ncbi:MAG: C4-dicarboxylate transporter DctA, partial [Acidobacteriaceae bacterium]|nr:C4-dicarboxylate transporter DctA [Acidobacteriaceae bacterium]